MKLNDEQNLAFMNDPRRVAAQKELDDAVESIRSCVELASAMTILTHIHQATKRLQAAYENLSIVEATVIAEVTGKII